MLIFQTSGLQLVTAWKQDLESLLLPDLALLWRESCASDTAIGCDLVGPRHLCWVSVFSTRQPLPKRTLSP